MDHIRRNCLYLIFIVFCFTSASANPCMELSKTNNSLKSFSYNNVEPDILLINSSNVQQFNDAKDIMSCYKTCCSNAECRSIFYQEEECFLVKCSFVGDVLCPSILNIVESSNWTWIMVKENMNTSDISKLFQDKLNSTKASIDIPVSNFSETTTTTAKMLDLGSTHVFTDHEIEKKSDKPYAVTENNPLQPVTTRSSDDSHISTTSPVTTTTTQKADLWVVSAGPARVTHMPENNLTLYATVVPEPPESEKSLYSYQWSMVLSPQSKGSGHMDGMSSPTLKLSMLNEGDYTLKVKVTKVNQSYEAFVNVTVLPAVRKNAPPIAKIMPSEQKLNQKNDLVLDGSESTDDDKIISYKWELLSGPATDFPLDTSFSSPVFKVKGPLTPGLYKFRLTVVDSNKATNHTDATVDVIKEIDYPPKANAGNNQIIQLPQNYVTLWGNASYDDIGIVSYEWTKDSTNLVNDMTGARTPYLQLSNLQEGDYIFTLTVTDASNQVDKAQVHVIVRPAQNHPPLADAGANQTLFLPLASIDLDASNSTDDVKVVSYLWTILNGPDNAKIENPDQMKAKLINPSVGVYVVRLMVADEAKLESTTVLHITVKQNQNAPPVAIAGNDMEVELNDEVGVVIINGSASHDDRGISKYVWTRDNKSPAAGVAIKASDHSPVLQLVGLVKGQYTWTLEVTDVDKLSNSSQMVLTVNRDSKEDYLVRMVLGVDSELFNGLYKAALQSHLEDLVKNNLGASQSKVYLRKLSQDPITGRMVIDFYAESKMKDDWLIHQGDEIETILKYELSAGFSNTLEFPIVDIFAVVCHRNCSGHGYCDITTRKCVCNSFWTSNWFKENFGSKETNCDWSVLYVIIIIIMIIVSMALLVWYVVYAMRRRFKKKSQPIRTLKKRHRYTLLDEASNGVKTNGDASHRQNPFSNKGLTLSKVLDDQSDSGSSSEDMIFLRSNNDHQLQTIRRNRSTDDRKKLLSDLNKKSTAEEDRDWLKSPKKDLIGRIP